ncbi:MAG: PAS domain-containing sensor histidine kinase, partial [Thermotogae bacterium]
SGEKKVAIISKKVGDKVVVEVADTGPGMSRSALKRIFDRFYRVDKGRSRKMGGSGLGLAIVKTIVDRHNGSINVASEPGEGTKFTIELPLVRSESENENV